MLYFDHCFTLDPNYKMMKRLEKCGFVLEKQTVEHPGKIFSRFIMLGAPNSVRGKHYLEFIHVKSGGEKMSWPGISFGFEKDLAKFHRQIQKRMPKAKFFHKNYDWKKDSESRLPGWNFIDFQKLKFTGFFPFMTEYEPHKKRKKTPPPKHANGVTAVHALIFDVNPEGKKFVKALMGKQKKMSCDTALILNPAKRTRLRQVVLRCKNLPKFIATYKVDKEIEWHNRPAALIRNPTKMWDVIII